MTPRTRGKRLGALALALLLTACSTGPEPAVEPGSPAGWPDFDYPAAARSQEVFLLDPQRSRVEVIVRREGPLARFGHDHVVGVRGLEGWLALDGGRGRSDLRFPVDLLEVDAPEARERHGLDTAPDREAIEGTERNLQARVLDSATWPWIELAVRDLSATGQDGAAQAEVTVRGETARVEWPYRLSRDPDGVVVEGRTQLRQTELGLAPFSVLGGGLRVANVIEIHYRLQGSRVRDP